jgi:hypothetical protein
MLLCLKKNRVDIFEHPFNNSKKKTSQFFVNLEKHVSNAQRYTRTRLVIGVFWCGRSQMREWEKIKKIEKGSCCKCKERID